ncbi:MAG: sigma 54-interacting transcriptional regulator [Holophagales bacterium]|nr:sigma 54-interacting transcriptional regulator [Holophagales bacterium]
MLGPVPASRVFPEELSDAEHAGFLVRLAGLLSFLGAHGLGLSAEGAKAIGMRPGSRDVPWLSSPPVPAWRAVPAPVVLGVSALRLAGRKVACGRTGEARKGFEEALGDGGLPTRSAEAVAAVLRAADGARPSDALLLDLARTGEVGEKVSLDLLGLAVPRELGPASGERLVAAGSVAEWVARGAARRAPGETAFAEAGPPMSAEDGAPLLELAGALGSDPRAEVLRALARGEAPAPHPGPPLALLARDLDRWDPLSLRAWEELPRFAGELTRIEIRPEAPPPWHGGALLVPRLGREEVSGLVHLPFSSPPAFSRFWEELASEAAGDPARLLGAARQRARSFLAGPRRASASRRAMPVDIVLRAAALLGDGFPLAEAAAVGGVSPERAVEVLEEACDGGILLRSARGAYRFTRQDQRRRLESDLTRAERDSCLTRLEAFGPEAFRLLLARLSARAEDSDVEEARLRLGEAIRTGRSEDVAGLLSRAPAAAPDFGEPLLAAQAHASAGRMDDARASAARIDAVRALEEPLEIRAGAARILARLGEGEKALALLPESASREGRLARVELLLRLRRESEAERILDATGGGEGPGSIRALLLRAELHERRQEFVAAESALKAVAAALTGSSDDLVPVDAGFTAGYLALGVGRPGEARAFFRSARDEARTPSRKADALFDLSVAAAEDGALAEAEASLEEALSLFSALGERDRYLTALGQRASLALRRSDAHSALGDLKTVLAHDRQPGRAFQLLFSIPLRQRLALADGDDSDGAEAFEEARSRFGECAEHPALREILVLEGARLLAGGSAAEALARLEEAEPRPDARSGVEPLRVRLVASSLRDLNRAAPAAPGLDLPERFLLEAEERLAKGLAPQPAARQALAGRLERPEGPFEVATRLVEWHGRFPSFFASEESSPLRELGLRAARRAGLDGTVARFQAPFASARRAETGGVAPPAATLVTEDAATREVFDTVRRVAPHRISVLVLGESGTGKELVAREVHRASRRTGPFVAVNVAALPENLAEAELFGSARGAFTGADRDRPGVVEASSGGTLFLDEIGDLSQQVQAKLLRVLQEREVRRLGETRTRAVDLRLVAATHRDLARLIGEGRFREDLLYRIAGITVTLSPLRERPRDLRVLLDRVLAGTPVAPEARAALLSWSWPGNIRELLHAVEAAKAMAGPAGRVEREHLPQPLRVATATPVEGKGWYRETVDEAKRRVILEALAKSGGNRTRAAALLGLSRQSLLYEMKRLAITD